MPLTVALVVRAGDTTDCKKRDLHLNQDAWIYNLPKPGELPPPGEVRSEGGFVILDEAVRNRGYCQYSFIGQAGTDAALRGMGSVSLSSGFNSEAHINARAMLPDGSIREAAPEDVSCSLVKYDRLRFLLPDSQLPKRYVVTLPGLLPGSVVHYQVSFRCGNYGYTFPNYLPIWNGFQHELLDGDAESQPWTYYRAANLRLIIVHNAGERVEATPLDGRQPLKIEHRQTAGGVQSFLQITATRPARPAEDFSPALADVSPRVMIHSPFSGPDEAGTWDKLIGDWRDTWLKHTRPDPDLWNFFVARNPIPEGAKPMAVALGINRYIRDTLKYSAAFHGPSQLIKPEKLLRKDLEATREEHLLLFIALLRTRGIPCRPILFRSRYEPPVLRQYPGIGWFHGYAVEVTTPEGRHYFDPDHLIEGGRLSDELVGAESIAIDPDSGKWEWLTLPGEHAEENEFSFRLTIDSVEGGTAKGRLTARATGRPAWRFRGDLKHRTDADRAQLLSEALDVASDEKLRFSDVKSENDEALDEPLLLTATFTIPDFAQVIGGKRIARPVAFRPMPSPSLFAKRPRMFDIVFRRPQLTRAEFVIPGGLLREALAVPPASVAALDTLRYRLETRMSGPDLVISREVRLEGAFEKSRIEEVHQFFLTADRADRDFSIGLK